ncbi:hypothetical protein BJX61DRAFT_533963 [Aspergillus egyptiacus]|nr:hypothetical protein BJX61DRAFT_533963 [Aspergillus egyptiacus]
MAELALGIAGLVSTVDLCLKAGKAVVTKYRTFKDADSQIRERILVIEATWSRISRQLAFLHHLQQRILLTFQSKLEVAVLEISKIERSWNTAQAKRAAAKYTLLVQESLDRAIKDLQTWAAEFDPTWWLIVRMADRAIDNTIDTELEQETKVKSFEAARHIRDVVRAEQSSAKGFFLKEATLQSSVHHDIPFSTSQLIELPSGKSTPFILDSVDCTAVDDVSMFARNVRDLAFKLEKIDPTTFHLLQCFGVSRVRDPNTRRVLSLNFIFKLPKDYNRPQSLRHLLLCTSNPSLTLRLSLAKQLATSLSYIHVLDFVHKNIRPETALVFESHDTSPFGPLLLVGFKTFRTAEGKSLRLTSADRIENMYQHPERQGIDPVTDHRMQHDIYSLGVCLLEIGLWESFAVGDNPTTPAPFAAARDSVTPKDSFTTMAKQHLPFRMGEKYTRVVVNCLTCMDPENEDFGDESEFEDVFGIRIGVKYIEKILLQLGEISV